MTTLIENAPTTRTAATDPARGVAAPTPPRLPGRNAPFPILRTVARGLAWFADNGPVGPAQAYLLGPLGSPLWTEGTDPR